VNSFTLLLHFREARGIIGCVSSSLRKAGFAIRQKNKGTQNLAQE
jgi:hypothetical protein